MELGRTTSIQLLGAYAEAISVECASYPWALGVAQSSLAGEGL